MQMLTKASALGLLSASALTAGVGRVGDVLVIKPVRIIFGAIEAVEDAMLLGNQSIRSATERNALTQTVRDKIKRDKLEAEMNESLVTYAEKSVELQERVGKLDEADKTALIKRKDLFPKFE